MNAVEVVYASPLIGPQLVIHLKRKGTREAEDESHRGRGKGKGARFAQSGDCVDVGEVLLPGTSISCAVHLFRTLLPPTPPYPFLPLSTIGRRETVGEIGK